MRALIQRVTSANVTVDKKIVGEIGQGLLVLLGVENGDQATDLEYTLKKTLNLRVFRDDDGKMNRSVKDIAGELLIVSQFTLLGDTRKGNRPGFTAAADPEIAKQMYEQFVARIREENVQVATGVFAADMQVQLANDGPVTLMIDSRARRVAD